MRRLKFVAGNEVRLLQCGADYFAALMEAITQASEDIYLETYIFTFDATANKVKHALIAAAARGVKVRVIIDWVGSGYQQAERLAHELVLAGVACRCFNRWFRRGLARTHRKICVVDQRIAFVGGLNIVDDLIADDGSGQILAYPRWDFAVAVTGALVVQIYTEAQVQWLRVGHLRLKQRLQLLLSQRNQVRHQDDALLHAAAAGVGGSAMFAAFVVRDNLRNRRTIQRAYLHALGTARHRAIIANPYFAPGRRLRRALVSAANRGVDVTLLIGVGQFALQDAVTHSFYPKLLKHGVKIVEYRKTQLHAKVAVIDDAWATVGSSNMDGLSLFVNQEANIMIKNKTFALALTAHLQQGIAEGVAVELADYVNQPWIKRLWHGTAFLIYRGLLRIATLGRYS